MKFLCEVEGNVADVPAGFVADVCERLAAELKSRRVDADRARILATLEDGESLAAVTIRIRNKQSLDLLYEEGEGKAWKNGRQDRCGPFEIGVIDADLGKGGMAMILQVVRRCRSRHPK